MQDFQMYCSLIQCCAIVGFCKDDECPSAKSNGLRASPKLHPRVFLMRHTLFIPVLGMHAWLKSAGISCDSGSFFIAGRFLHLLLQNSTTKSVKSASHTPTSSNIIP